MDENVLAKLRCDPVNHKQAIYKKESDQLSDAYVRGVLAMSLQVSRRDIPAELIPVKRAHLKLMRAIREVENNGSV